MLMSTLGETGPTSSGRAGAAVPQLPALEAVILYLRPSLRIHLLGALAELGVFVSETTSLPAITLPLARFAGRADLLILVCDDSDEHRQLLAALPAESATVVVAIIPSASRRTRLLDAGAFACCDEELSRAALLATLTLAAERARQSRQFREAGGATLFGDVVFQQDPPLLMREGTAVALSRSEGRVLTTLVAARGEPVEKQALENQGDLVINAANLKTIVMRLRRKVASLGGDPVMLCSVRGFGYVLRG